jgi:hypothetical protein
LAPNKVSSECTGPEEVPFPTGASLCPKAHCCTSGFVSRSNSFDLPGRGSQAHSNGLSNSGSTPKPLSLAACEEITALKDFGEFAAVGFNLHQELLFSWLLGENLLIFCTGFLFFEELKFLRASDILRCQ